MSVRSCLKNLMSSRIASYLKKGGFGFCVIHILSSFWKMLLSFCENEGFSFEDVGHSYQPKVKPASENWATEYQQQYNGGASWADEFAHDEVFRGPDHWANEFGAERLQQESVDDQWVNEFSKLHVDDWAEEFGRQVGEGALGDSSPDNWANSYDEFLSGRTLQGVSMYFLIRIHMLAIKIL